MAGVRKLKTNEQAHAMDDYIQGGDVKVIAKKLKVSVRTIYNVLDAANIHRCRSIPCGRVVS